MYVCLCEGISDKAIQKAIDEGCCSVKMIRDATGAAKKCCKCVAEIQSMIASSQDNLSDTTVKLFHHA